MLRKNISAVMATILTGLLFIVIGSCFSAFVYKNEVVKVENPRLILASGITIYDEEGQQEIEKLELSKMKLGLKPATGEEDNETNVPITITDKQGSEGQYAKFKVVSTQACNIYIQNIKVSSDKNVEEINKERENIMASIKEFNGKAISLKEDKVLLGRIDPGENKDLLTFYIWLSSKASDILESSTISFDLSFENS